MIENITIQSVASYGPEPQTFGPLKKLNFIFGTNGTGKTTISRIIEAEDSSCSVDWDGGTRLKTLVYNRDFVERNFGPNSDPNLKGIFTLGEEDKKAEERLQEAKEEQRRLSEEIQRLENNLNGDNARGGLQDLEKDFTERFWTLKTKYYSKFKEAFKGHVGRKEDFKDHLIKESESNESALESLDTLETSADTLYGDAPERIDEIIVPEGNALITLESDSILARKIVGKADVDIAAMIKKLSNSDWVKHGREYYDLNEGVCPFCQQPVQESFEKSLNEYFDESFEAGLQAISELKEKYFQASTELEEAFQDILTEPCDFFDEEILLAKIQVVQSIIQGNIKLLEEKCQSPGEAISLITIASALDEVQDLIRKVNLQIQEHNKRVSNLDQGKRNLTAKIWRFLVEEVKDDLAFFKEKKSRKLQAIESLSGRIKSKKVERDEITNRIRELERSTTSIQPTIDGINGILTTFGFTGFQLAPSKEPRHYRIIRPDGTPVENTLSEGERNFITFLYFYHLLKGSKSEEEITDDRIVVFDDPVSSLDCDVLFVVSSLIRELFNDTKKNRGNIKQIFVLTHNVYFHTEVSYGIQPDDGKCTFWVVKKRAGDSVICCHRGNPIKTSYQLLWSEVKDSSSHTILNSMRRILEYYFRILGRKPNYDEMIDNFDGGDKTICRSLISIVNAGSHSTFDDLYIAPADIVPERYSTVFKKIFEESGHIAHYDMMMGDDAA